MSRKKPRGFRVSRVNLQCGQHKNGDAQITMLGIKEGPAGIV
jgi:hypothetical protein